MRAKLQLASFTYTFCILCLFSSYAQLVSFSRVVPPQGKTFEHVTGITQDKNGFMWFASKKGLYKYNGLGMTVYRNDPLNPLSLTSNLLETIFADADGTIWVGSLGNGLDHYNPATGTFKHYRYHPNQPGGLSNDTVTSILRDRQGNLWVGTHQGLDRFDNKTGTFQHYRHQPGNPSSLSSRQVRAIYEDRQGVVWVGCGSPFADNGGSPEEGGLNRFDRGKGTFVRYLHHPSDEASLSNNKVRAIFEDSKGNFWVGTAGSIGLHSLDRKTGLFKRYSYNPAQPEKLSRPPVDNRFLAWDHITFIQEDASGNLWIGTAAAGMNQYNPATQKVTFHRPWPDVSGSDDGSNPWWAFTSRDNLLWISTNKGELFKMDPFQLKFSYSNLQRNFINGFCEDENGAIWFATNSGIVQTDNKRQVVKVWTNDPKDITSLSDNTVLSLTKDRSGTLWVGTLNGGLNKLDARQGKFVRYQHHRDKKESLSGDFVLPIYEDREGVLWVGTNNGLSKMNRQTGAFTTYLFYPTTADTYGNNLVSSILEDQQGRLWAGTWMGGGIHRVSKQNGTFKTYLKSLSITRIFEDHKGVLWVGATDGLYRYDAKLDEFLPFADPSSGQGIADVISIIEDRRGSLWITASEGLIRLNRERDEISFYGLENGIGENGFLYASAYISREGELFFGDSTGYFSFFPDELTKKIKPPAITFLNLWLSDKMIVPGKNALLPKPLSETEKLTLNFSQNIFSIDFAATDFANPEKNRQLFMLENYDVAWRKAGPDMRAYYFNVPPGSYKFRVKAVNSKGVWSEKALTILVTPPWWQKWWAYVLFVVLAAGGIWGLIWYRSRKLKQENVLLEKRVADRTQQLHQSLEDLKAAQTHLIQREKMASLGELTAGIAHEIQNPLNFVNNFSEVSFDMLGELEEALRRNEKAEAEEILSVVKANLQKIQEHGDRAGSIVKNMLQHSRKSVNRKEAVELNAFVEEYLRLSYHGMRAKDKAFHAILETHFDAGIKSVHVNTQEFGRVLLNLFNNAFYAVHEKRKRGLLFEPVVQVTTIRKGDSIEIHVKDNGTGIPEKVLDKIYQPFFTTKPSGEGTGLGLSLSYDIITKGHGGRLQVLSKEGEGAEFRVMLPAEN